MSGNIINVSTVHFGQWDKSLNVLVDGESIEEINEFAYKTVGLGWIIRMLCVNLITRRQIEAQEQQHEHLNKFIHHSFRYDDRLTTAPPTNVLSVMIVIRK